MPTSCSPAGEDRGIQGIWMNGGRVLLIVLAAALAACTSGAPEEKAMTAHEAWLRSRNWPTRPSPRLLRRPNSRQTLFQAGRLARAVSLAIQDNVTTGTASAPCTGRGRRGATCKGSRPILECAGSSRDRLARGPYRRPFAPARTDSPIGLCSRARSSAPSLAARLRVLIPFRATHNSLGSRGWLLTRSSRSSPALLAGLMS